MDNVFTATVKWAEGKGLKVWHRPEVASTNDAAKDNSGFAIYLTAHQTAGRGRGTHSWSDVAGGRQLLATWAFELSAPPQHITGPLLGLAVYRACKAVWPHLAWSIKAPNDLYLGEKKVAGLLAETVSSGSSSRLLVGFGFNALAHPMEIPEAGTLTDSPGEDQWQDFLNRLYANLEWAAAECTQPQLSASTREKLLETLNLYPGLGERYTQVDQDGNLYTATRKIPWHEL